ncbi:hypothetical protein B9Z19DRAFT_1124532 [Tuber borchii]|uniref:Uncharacterized protein n=1 Tax=Tuber borchii TaxID=42251 RepID=A0A2T6ZWJ4_TUBBO|nr:hypothetical protein B9Z19DRAFT_1124532 [Tuber borchii]
MADSGANPAAPLEPLQASEIGRGPISQPSLQSLPSQESADHVDGWEIIGEQQDFYDERDCLHPSYSLASGKLKNRKVDDVVIFGYSLDPDYLKNEDGNPPTESATSSRPFSADDDIFFRMPKNELKEPEQFDRLLQGLRLGIM